MPTVVRDVTIDVDVAAFHRTRSTEHDAGSALSAARSDATPLSLLEEVHRAVAANPPSAAAGWGHEDQQDVAPLHANGETCDDRDVDDAVNATWMSREATAGGDAGGPSSMPIPVLSGGVVVSSSVDSNSAFVEALQSGMIKTARQCSCCVHTAHEVDTHHPHMTVDRPHEEVDDGHDEHRHDDHDDDGHRWCTALPHDSVPGPLVSWLLDSFLDVESLVIPDKDWVRQCDGLEFPQRTASEAILTVITAEESQPVRCHSLMIEASPHVTDATVAEIATHETFSAKLTMLFLLTCPQISSDIGDHICKFQNLRKLFLTKLMNVTSYTVARIASGCKKLATLQLIDCRALDESVMDTLALSFPALDDLTMTCSTILTAGAMRRLGKSESLTALTVTASNFGDASAAALSGNPVDEGNLLGLPVREARAENLLSSTTLTTRDEEDHSGVASGLSSLCSLTATHCGNVTDAIGVSLSSFPHLTEVNLKRTGITDSFFSSIQTCQCLKTLHLSGTIVTGRGLANLHGTAVSRSLSSLFLSECPLIDSVCAESITALPELETVDLDTTRVGDKTVAAMAAHCHRLKRLDISSSAVTDAALFALADGCTRITAMNLTFTAVTDEGLTALAHSAPRLKSVTLVGCERVRRQYSFTV